MAIFDGEPVNAEVINREKMSRTDDTDTTGILSLKNDDSTHVANVQTYFHKIAAAVGIAGETAIDDNDYSSNNYILDGDSRKTAIGKLDQSLKNTNDDLTALDVREAANNSNQQVELNNHETRLQSLESGNMTIAGDKTFSGSTLFTGNVEMTGTVTKVNSTDLEVEDKLVTINKGGTLASAENSGIEVERPTTDNGQFLFDSTIDSNWKIGVVGALYGVLVSGIAQTIIGIKSFVNGIKTDTVNEYTAAAGVTIDGVLVKDGLVDGRDVSADGATLDAHVANTSNPHATTAAQVGADPAGTAAASMSAHLAASDPHSQYLTGSEGDAAYLNRSANDFSTFTEKTSIVNNDLFLIEDSGASGAKKKIKFQSFKSFLYENFNSSLAGGGSMPTPSVDKLNYSNQVSSTGGAVTLSTTPFGSGNTSTVPQFITLIGTSDTNTVKIVDSDTADGCLLNGDCVLYRGSVLNLVWTPSLSRYCEISRSQLGV